MVKIFSYRLRNLKFHYRVPKTAPLGNMLSQLHSVHTSHTTSLIYTLILSCHLRLNLPNVILFSRFLNLRSERFREILCVTVERKLHSIRWQKQCFFLIH